MASTESRIERSKKRIKDYESQIASGKLTKEQVGYHKTSIQKEQDRIKKRGGQLDRQQSHDAGLVAKGKDPSTNIATAAQVAYNKTLKDQNAAAAKRTEEKEFNALPTTPARGMGDLDAQARAGQAKQLLDIAAQEEADAEPSSGWGNVWRTLAAPFQGVHVSSDLDNPALQKVTEYVGNHPISTVLALGTVGLAVRGAVAVASAINLRTAAGIGTPTKLATGAVKYGATAASVRTGAAAVTNTVQRKVGTNAMVKAGFTLGAIFMIQNTAEKAASTYPFSAFQIAEAMDKIAYARTRATAEGRTDLVAELNQLEEEMLNPEGWAKFQSMTPWLNSWRATNENIAAGVAASAVYKKMAADELVRVQNGEGENDKYARARQEQFDMDLAVTDHWAEEQERLLNLSQEAQAAARASKRNEEVAARNADAAFWAGEAEKTRQLEAADRKAVADFWTAYHKAHAKMASDNRPSNLNFGLL